MADGATMVAMVHGGHSLPMMLCVAAMRVVRELPMALTAAVGMAFSRLTTATDRLATAMTTAITRIVARGPAIGAGLFPLGRATAARVESMVWVAAWTTAFIAIYVTAFIVTCAIGWLIAAASLVAAVMPSVWCLVFGFGVPVWHGEAGDGVAPRRRRCVYKMYCCHDPPGRGGALP